MGIYTVYIYIHIDGLYHPFMVMTGGWFMALFHPIVHDIPIKPY
jgi:hypothetical protein